MTSVLIRRKIQRHTGRKMLCEDRARNLSNISTVPWPVPWQVMPRAVSNLQKAQNHQAQGGTLLDLYLFLTENSFDLQKSKTFQQKRTNMLAGLCVPSSELSQWPHIYLGSFQSTKSQRDLLKTQIRWCQPSPSNPVMMSHCSSNKD